MMTLRMSMTEKKKPAALMTVQNSRGANLGMMLASNTPAGIRQYHHHRLSRCGAGARFLAICASASLIVAKKEAKRNPMQPVPASDASQISSTFPMLI